MVLHKAYKHVFEQLYPSPCQDLQIRVNPHKANIT
jgi:hypothetical protein